MKVEQTLLHRKSTKIDPIHGNCYETPQYFFDALNREFNFSFDLACNSLNKKTPYGFEYPDICALKSDWPKGEWLWLNPPYKPLRCWVEKTQEQVSKGAKVVMLIPPVVLACKYFSKLKPREIRFVCGRIKFLIDGKPMKSNTRDSMVLVYDGNPEIAKTTWINN